MKDIEYICLMSTSQKRVLIHFKNPDIAQTASTQLSMSTNSVRYNLKLLLKMGLVRLVYVKKRSDYDQMSFGHSGISKAIYQATETGLRIIPQIPKINLKKELEAKEQRKIKRRKVMRKMRERAAAKPPPQKPEPQKQPAPPQQKQQPQQQTPEDRQTDRDNYFYRLFLEAATEYVQNCRNSLRKIKILDMVEYAETHKNITHADAQKYVARAIVEKKIVIKNK